MRRIVATRLYLIHQRKYICFQLLWILELIDIFEVVAVILMSRRTHLLIHAKCSICGPAHTPLLLALLHGLLQAAQM